MQLMKRENLAIMHLLFKCSLVELRDILSSGTAHFRWNFVGLIGIHSGIKDAT